VEIFLTSQKKAWKKKLTGIKIHGNIIQVQLRNRIIGTLQIGIMGISTLRNTHIGHQIC
jgi:hypothetical protein